MDGKLKRSDVRLNNQKIIKYCKAENTYQEYVFRPKVEAGKMAAMVAAEKYCIILELRELVEDMVARKISWQDLRKQVKSVPISNRGLQGSLF